MKKTGFDAWCARAVSCISYPPDREELRQELLWHLEDSAEFLTGSGLSREEAEARAMEEMGDPRQVGALLRKVHKPWLGALHFATNLLVGVLVFFVILELLMNGSGVWVRQEVERLIALEAPTGEQLLESFSYGQPEEYVLVAEPEPELSAFSCGDYRFEVTGAWLWYRESDGRYLLSFSMDYSSPRFWLGAPEGMQDFLCAVESGGQVHAPLHWPYHSDGDMMLSMNSGGSAATAVGSISGGVTVDADSRWVDIMYAHGEGFSLRLNWGGGL